jgi:hypothetical protein
MKLIFVYNAKSGIVQGMLDSLHKIASPDTYACSLCAITYGMFAVHRNWRAYLQELPYEMVFHHRPDFRAAYPQVDVALPVILADEGGVISTLLDAQAMKALKNVDALVTALDAALAAHPLRSAEAPLASEPR